MGFINPYKQYRAPHDRRLKKNRRKEESFIFPNQKGRGKKKMLNEIEPLTALTPKICQIVGVPKCNGQPFLQSEASTVLYLCVHLLVPVGIELYRS